MLNPISNFSFKMLVLLSKKLYLHIRVNNNTTFGTIFGARKLYFKKIHLRGSSCNTGASACCIYHFTLQILQSSAQNPFRAEDFCSTIIEAQIFETQKPQKAHRCARDLLWWFRNLQHTYSVKIATAQ